MSTPDLRAKFRPLPRVARYPTGWAGELTFTEIRAALTPSINRLMRYYNYIEVDIPDMMAHGFMRLWEALSEQPNLLAERDQGGAVKWVMYRSNMSHYRKFDRREVYLDELATASGEADDFLIDGYDRGFNGSNHASFAEAIDARFDIERGINQIAEKYKDSLPHLAALYYITTSVKPGDAAALAGRGGTKQSWWQTSIVKPLREELCDLFELSRPPKITWRDKVAAGDTDPLQQLVARLEAEGKTPLAEIVDGLGRHENCAAQMAQLGLPKTRIHYWRREAHQALNQAYGCRI